MKKHSAFSLVTLTFTVLGSVLLLQMSSVFAEVSKPTPRVDNECSRIAKKLSSVGYKECLSRQLQHSGSVSTQGAPILIKEYPPLANQWVEFFLLVVFMVMSILPSVSRLIGSSYWINIIQVYFIGEFLP